MYIFLTFLSDGSKSVNTAFRNDHLYSFLHGSSYKYNTPPSGISISNLFQKTVVQYACTCMLVLNILLLF